MTKRHTIATLAALALLLIGVTSCGSGAPKATLEGFWDDFGPTTLLDDVEAAEQKLVAWGELLLEADSTAREASVGEFLEVMVADQVCYYVWSEWVMLHLYGVWSPVRNEEAVMMLLERVVADERIAPEDKAGIPELIGVLTHNRVGEAAQEFAMFDTQAAEYHLADFRGRRVLLLLIDTTCPSCVDTMQEIENSRGVMAASQRGELALVAVAINQNPQSVAHFAEQKSGTPWQIFCASGLEISRAHYDTQAAPVLFLLSPEGRVEVGMTRDVKSIENILKNK